MRWIIFLLFLLIMPVALADVIVSDMTPLEKITIEAFAQREGLTITQTTALPSGQHIIISRANNNPLYTQEFGTWNKPAGVWEIKRIGGNTYLIGTTNEDVVKAVHYYETTLEERFAPGYLLWVALVLIFIPLCVFGVVFGLKIKQKHPSELHAYIAYCRKQGFSTPRIKEALLKAGWPEKDIEHALESFL